MILQGFLNDKLGETTMLNVVAGFMGQFYFSEDTEYDTSGFSDKLQDILGDLEGRVSYFGGNGRIS